jgi:hypothetical protein
VEYVLKHVQHARVKVGNEWVEFERTHMHCSFHTRGVDVVVPHPRCIRGTSNLVLPAPPPLDSTPCTPPRTLDQNAHRQRDATVRR